MLRSILAIFLGVLVGGIVVGLIEIPGYFIHPAPPGLDMKDAAALKRHFEKAPLAALAGVGVAWAVGPFVGAWLAALIARRAFLIHGLIVGAIFVFLDVVNLLSFPHPLWLAIIGVLAPPISSYFGATLAARMTRPPSIAQPYDMREKNMAC
jgi:hypothetical protein